MATEKHTKIWTEVWAQETHETEYALKRIKSAQSAKLTPVEINSNDSYGYFQGSSGRYETFLDYRKLTTKQSRAASHLQVLVAIFVAIDCHVSISIDLPSSLE